VTHALLLARSLEQRGGKVFVDVDAIPPGVDFVDYVAEHIESSDVMVVLIGPNWLNVTGHSGGRRIDDPADQVRVEVETALQRDMPLFPVLVGGALMPRPHDLPASLQRLARMNAVELREIDWDQGVDQLWRALPGANSPKPAPAPTSVAFPSRFTDRWFAQNVAGLGTEEMRALLEELRRRNWQDWEIEKRVLIHRDRNGTDEPSAEPQVSPQRPPGERPPSSEAATLALDDSDEIAIATEVAAGELTVVESVHGRPPRERDLAEALGRALGNARVERRWDVPHWSPQPGNIDVWTSDWRGRPKVLIETKLKDGNDIYESLWDLIKLLCLDTLDHVEATYLVVGTTVRNWEKPVAFADVFRDGRYDLVGIIEDYPDWWRWCLEGGRARPLRMPAEVDVVVVARIAFALHGVPWELRAARISSGESWVECADGWPLAHT
jgi:hypothetical protein